MIKILKIFDELLQTFFWEIKIYFRHTIEITRKIYYIFVWIYSTRMRLLLGIHFCSRFVHIRVKLAAGSSGDQREMPGIRFGMASNDGSWFAAFRRGTSPGRFASCDLYPVYSSCTSRPPPGISRDVCGYLTRENNLRGYIVFARVYLAYTI